MVKRQKQQSNKKRERFPEREAAPFFGGENGGSCKGAMQRLFIMTASCLMTGLKYEFMPIRRNRAIALERRVRRQKGPDYRQREKT